MQPRPLFIIISFLLSQLAISSPAGQDTCNVRSIDFLNHTYYVSELEYSESITLVNGVMTRYLDASAPPLHATAYPVMYADLDGDCKEEAIVALDVPTWGSDVAHLYLYVFKCQGSYLDCVYSKGFEQGEEMQAHEDSIIITAPFWLEDDPHCCPTFKGKYTVMCICGQYKIDDLQLTKNPTSWPCQ